MGAIQDRETLIRTYRQINSPYEGHVNRHVPGIDFGTGPLGVGVSAAAGFALTQKKNQENKKVYALIGDGEIQEGQVFEMGCFANKYALDNLVVFVDYNRVQLSRSLDETMPLDIASLFQSLKWNVLRIDGHDPESIWKALREADTAKSPTLILAQTIMGKGISEMEKDGKALKANWHGAPPKPKQSEAMISRLSLTVEEQELLEAFRTDRAFRPIPNKCEKSLKKLDTVDTGSPRMYSPEENVAPRVAYGKALLDLVQKNSNIYAATADVSQSVRTDLVETHVPEKFIEFGIAEQNMMTVCGAMSLEGQIPFVSTFGVFMTSRAKDQARVNDINCGNVKMVSTHCGLSVGEDGPTHQAIDDMGSFMGLFHTHITEPADANHCDRIIRYIASHYGNFYTRMGRHALPVLTKEDGSPFYDEMYQYEYGKCDLLRVGKKVTIAVSGSLVSEALKAREISGVDAEIVIVSSPKKFDTVLENSVRKTKKVIVVEDHNPSSGYTASISLFLREKGIDVDFFHSFAVRAYQLSGKAHQLYQNAKIESEAIAKTLKSIEGNP
jgi:transketolase